MTIAEPETQATEARTAAPAPAATPAATPPPPKIIWHADGSGEGDDAREYYRMLTLHQLAIALGQSYQNVRRAFARGKFGSNCLGIDDRPYFFAGCVDEIQKALEK